MSTAAPRVIAIGDVHGCVHALEALIDEIAPTTDDRLVFLGDVVDHGRDTKEALELILALQGRCRVTLIQGNHEEMMLAARGDEAAMQFWMNCGGVATLNSYRFGARIGEAPPEHWALLQSCVPYFETHDTIFTHANYLPEAPMDQQPGRQLRWALFDPEDARPHVSGKTVVVGHTEQRSAELVDLGFVVCIDTACWRYGWLTALERPSNHVWQASRWGRLRDPGEANHIEPLAAMLRKSPQAGERQLVEAGTSSAASPARMAGK